MLKFMREELEFVDGRFINEYSHQRYNGSSKKIGEFLKILTEAAPDPVTIEFRDFEKDDKTAFHLSQASARTTVIVNTTGSPALAMETSAVLVTERSTLEIATSTLDELFAVFMSIGLEFWIVAVLVRTCPAVPLSTVAVMTSRP